MTETGPQLDVLEPGLRGYTMRHNDALYVPLLQADKPGSGALTRYLTRLEQEEPIIRIPNVVNARLVNYLDRRGYKLRFEYSEQFGEAIDVWEYRKEVPRDDED